MGEKAIRSGGFFLGFLLIAILSPALSEKKEVFSSWAASSAAIDGSDEEWNQEVVCIEKKYKVNYGFKNDENNLYILFKFNDLSYLSSINNTGMIIWLSPEKEKKKDYGLRFLRKNVPTETFLYLLTQQRGAIPDKDKEQIRKKPFHFVYSIEIICKKQGFPGVVVNQESYPAHFRGASTDEQVTYEFVIPLEMEGDRDILQRTKPGQAVNVGFEWGTDRGDEKREDKENTDWVKVRLAMKGQPG